MVELTNIMRALPDIPTAGNYYLLVDDNADCLSPSNKYALSHQGGGIWSAGSVAIANGDYFTISAYTRRVIVVDTN